MSIDRQGIQPTMPLSRRPRQGLALSAVMLVAAVITACSNGSDSRSPVEPDAGKVLTGSLLPLVAGLHYATPSMSGATDAQGQFSFRQGETIEFRLGATVLGTVPARSTLTVADLAETPVVTGTQALLQVLSGYQTMDTSGFPPGIYPYYWHPFQGVMNRLLFLHSLDQDQNPANGVQIHPAAAEMLRDTRIQFLLEWRDFRDSLELRKARIEAQALGAFDASLLPVPYARIMDAFYAALDQSPGIYNIRRQYSSGVYSIDYYYDSNDLPVRREFGSEVQEYRRNEAGQVTYYKDECGDITNATYDPLGNMLRADSPYHRQTWEYDHYSSLVHWQDIKPEDGVVISYRTIGRDEQGREVRVEDGNESGATALTVITRDARGNAMRTEEFEPGESTNPREVELRDFDENNRQVRLESRSASRGLESVRTWGYDDRGFITTSSLTRYTEDFPYGTERRWYDRAGHVIRFESDRDSNSQPESILRSTWDETGNESERVEDTDADGDADKITTFEYDQGGQLVFTHVDENGDGETDSTTRANYRYEYDAEGRIVLLESDQDGDGRLDNLLRYEYDAAGNMVKEIEEIGFYGLTTQFEYKTMGWVGIFNQWERVGNFQIFDYTPCTCELEGTC
jgi:YD repeat-containing protein